MADSLFSNVSLLLAGEGVNGGSVFTDSSYTPKTISIYAGTPTTSSTQSKIGLTSIYLPGTALSTLTTPDHANFDFGTGNFAIDVWAYPLSGAAGAQTIIAQSTGSTGQWGLSLDSTATQIQFIFNNSSFTATVASMVGAWHHIAAVRNGTSFQLYLDGVAVGTPGISASAVTASTEAVTIGQRSNTNLYKGYLDNLRVTTGVSRYTSAFTPPATAGDYEQPTEHITSSVSLPSLTGTAVGHDSAGEQAAAITLPSLVAVAYGAVRSDFSLPSLTATAQGYDSTGERAADITLPSLTVAIRTGAKSAVSLPKLSSAAAGTVTNLADANISLPSLAAASSVTVSGMASAAISLPSMSGSSYAGALCSITIGSLTTQATGTTGSLGRAQVTLPLFQATAIATAQSRGSAAIVLPSLQIGATVRAALILPSLQLTVIGTAVVTATYEAYAVNLKHTPRGNEQPVDEVTRYTNFPFTHVVRYKNSYYGANSTGLYLLEGTTDAGTPIPWEVKTAITDFKSPNKKTLAAAYFSGRFGPSSTISLHEGEKAPNTYNFTTPRGALAQNHRAKFGKGLKGRYYSLSVSGNGVCDLDAIELEVHNLSRRI